MLKHHLILINQIVAMLFIILSCSVNPKRQGVSISKGSVSNGKLINGRKFSYRTKNYKFFSPISYSVLNRAWVHSKVLDITNEAYKSLKNKYPEKKFLLMECSKKKGGKILPHQTHQNGVSIDFGVPLVKKGKPWNIHHCYGIYHYAMRFNNDGQLKRNKKIVIDFKAMADHILLLDKFARKRGMYVRKVILKVELIDNLFSTKSGKILKHKRIYFPKRLSKTLNKLHDDHYHIDFGFLKN